MFSDVEKMIPFYKVTKHFFSCPQTLSCNKKNLKNLVPRKKFLGQEKTVLSYNKNFVLLQEKKIVPRKKFLGQEKLCFVTISRIFFLSIRNHFCWSRVTVPRRT